VLLSLQTARYLIKARADARAGRPLAGLTAGLALLADPGFHPLSDGRAALGLPPSAASPEELTHVRKTPSRLRSRPTLAFYRGISTGMHGTTCIF
jgi:hypothetical protein